MTATKLSMEGVTESQNLQVLAVKILRSIPYISQFGKDPR
jgi:hypothetical protein